MTENFNGVLRQLRDKSHDSYIFGLISEGGDIPVPSSATKKQSNAIALRWGIESNRLKFNCTHIPCSQNCSHPSEHEGQEMQLSTMQPTPTFSPTCNSSQLKMNKNCLTFLVKLIMKNSTIAIVQVFHWHQHRLGGTEHLTQKRRQKSKYQQYLDIMPILLILTEICAIHKWRKNFKTGAKIRQ